MNKKHTYSTYSLIFALLIVSLLLVAFKGFAHNHSALNMADRVEIKHAWARATFALAKTGAAYMEIQNTSDKSIHLVSATVSENIAASVELHHTIMTNDMMQMQELEDGIVLAAQEKAMFVPGGKHIMLMGLMGPLEKGSSVEITLAFSDGSSKSHIFNILDKRMDSGASHKHH